MTVDGGQEWVVSFSLKGDDRSKWYALTNCDRILPILKFMDDEGDEVDDVDDAFSMTAGWEGVMVFLIQIGNWELRETN